MILLNTAAFLLLSSLVLGQDSPSQYYIEESQPSGRFDSYLIFPAVYRKCRLCNISVQTVRESQ